MPRRFLLEPVYAAAEYDGRYPAAQRAVGAMLDAVLDGPSPDPEMDRLLERLHNRPQPTRH